MTPPNNESDTERQRLRQEYDALPKTPHGVNERRRHEEVQPEWIVRILNDPYDEWPETSTDGELITILVGRVPEFQQWIRIVMLGTRSRGEIHTAYPDRRLEKRFGGRPWGTIL